MKITAIIGGRDWNDASVEFVILPEGKTIEEFNKEYQEWYETYTTHDKYYSLFGWILSHGGRLPTIEELQTYYE